MYDDTNEPSHQDPAEPNQVDTEVETNEQPEPEAPQPVEPEAVEVTPEPTPTEVKTDTVHGKDYEVTADRGYRRT